MEQWQDVVSHQLELITTRLTELLSRGQLWIKTELGVDLGLNPELIPPWVILLAACTGLVLMVILWASLCRAAFKKQPVSKAAEDYVTGVKRTAKPVKDEPKKKKKKSEKKSQPNGRAAVEPQEEEALVPEEIVPHHHEPPPSQGKTEKAAEVKKSKKKAKQAVKEPATIVTDSKEPEEGTWETKVSNKEKREQRKKDKGSSDGSSSPGGVDSRVSIATEQPKTSPAVLPANQKKKKGGEVKSEKIEAEVPKAPVKADPTAAHVPIAVMTKVPPQTVAPKTVNWTTNREPASLWSSEIDGSWTVIDRSSLGTFTALGVPSTESKPMSQLPWLNQPAVDDEWSGINGGGIDYNSDWNAPSEVWGNYEEPASPDPVPVQEPPVPEPDKNNLLIEAANDDNEKEKEDITGDGAAKSKRKKKKKKKAAEEGATSGQSEEPEKDAPVSSMKQPPLVQEIQASVQTVKVTATEVKAEQNLKENVVQKPPVTQVPQKPADMEPTAKSNPASTQQKKPEESQAPKPAKKKKARRET
ncbi:hypothetical protein NL108_000119 [Boleophthalmus pectinirostris]|uniref:protein LYRIC-like n=1 Tax=Boleophthalmus pectinirostris TaxID=150288 RepID=UPI000A1C3ED4|nr:protein LYRIC-like [Boleophthalmus pectinirostris]KAJ0065883.1 hypothetical protein NL108_000119 [Boleophthalmus pectinirostris]